MISRSPMLEHHYASIIECPTQYRWEYFGTSVSHVNNDSVIPINNIRGVLCLHDMMGNISVDISGFHLTNQTVQQ